MKLHGRLKQTLALILAASSVVSATPVFAIDYTGHWAEQAIDEWKEKGILNGYEDGSFRPKESITRAEFGKILVQLLGLIVTDGAETFKDVKEDEWYTEYIKLVSAAGYMKGTEGNFRPNAYITREEAAYAIATAYHMTGETDKVFIDQEDISDWAEDSIKALVAAGCIEGYPDGTLKPQGHLTRAEAVSMLDKITAEIINTSGTYTEDVEGNLVINKDDVILQDMTIHGNLYLAEGIGEGDVELKNVKVLGATIVEGGGVHSIKVIKSVLNQIIVHKQLNPVRIVTDEESKVPEVLVVSPAILEGKLQEVKVLTPEEVKIKAAEVSEVHILEEKAKIVLHEEAVVEKLLAHAPSEIVVEGTLKEAVVNANEVIFYNKPEKIEVVEGAEHPIIIEPSKPETSKPESSTSEESVPNIPNTPEKPNTPDIPSTPEKPDTPDIPSIPETPDKPNTPPDDENNGDNTTPSVIVTEVEVVTPPNKTTYTEGEALDLTGLEVKLIKSDGTTEVVSVEDFSKKGLTTTLAHGMVLALEHIAVEITHTESGNKVVQSITVTEGDKQPPILNYTESLELEVEVNTDFTIPEVTATDNVDDEVEVKYEIKDGKGQSVTSIDTSKLGTYTITYTAKDKAGNEAKPLEIKVSVVDNEAPKFEYTGETVITKQVGEDFDMPEVTAEDNVDSEVEVEVEIKKGDQIVDSINKDEVGTYTITYTAVDQSGNEATLIITVNIIPEPIEIQDIKIENETTITFNTPIDLTGLVVEWNGEAAEAAVTQSISGTTVTYKVNNMKSKNTLEIFQEGLSVYNNKDIVPTFDWKNSTDTTWYDENQTVFKISTASQLAGLAELVNGGTDFKGKTIQLIQDIDLLDLEWTPIGGASKESEQNGVVKQAEVFKGTFDGNNHTISNLYIANLFADDEATNKNTDVRTYNVGLFGKVEGSIKNVNLDTATILGKQRSTMKYYYGKYIGALVGNMEGDITACTVSNIEIRAENSIGGIVGRIRGNVEKCQATNLNIYGVRDVGGIIGSLNSESEGGYKVNECIVQKLDIFIYTQNVGGIVGYSNGAVTLSKCELNEENIIEGGSSFTGTLGGIIGSVKKDKKVIIENCFVNKEGLTMYLDYFNFIFVQRYIGWYMGCWLQDDGKESDRSPYKIQQGDNIFSDSNGGEFNLDDNIIQEEDVEQLSILQELATPEETPQLPEEEATPEETPQLPEEEATPEETPQLPEEVTPEEMPQLPEEETTPEQTPQLPEEEAIPGETPELSDEESQASEEEVTSEDMQQSQEEVTPEELPQVLE